MQHVYTCEIQSVILIKGYKCTDGLGYRLVSSTYLVMHEVLGLTPSTTCL